MFLALDQGLVTSHRGTLVQWVVASGALATAPKIFTP